MSLRATCNSSNIYDQLGTFSSDLCPRKQNYGTCYAESAAYTYNIAKSNTSKSIHPFYFMTFVGDQEDDKTVNGGYTGQFINSSHSNWICPSQSVEKFVDEFSSIVNELFNLNITNQQAEADVIAIMQAMYIFKDMNLKDNQRDVLNYFNIKKIKEKEVYLNNVESFARKFSYSTSTMVRDNTYVDIKTLSALNSLERKYKENLIEIMKIHYKKQEVLKLTTATEKKINSLNYKIYTSLKERDKSSFKEVLLAILNTTCHKNEKVEIDETLVLGSEVYFEDISEKEALSSMAGYLKRNVPIRLRINASAFKENMSGLHGVVLMGTRATRNRTCELLIRNSWGTDYGSNTSCHCFDNKTQQFKSCNSQYIKDSETVLACWYEWNQLNKDLLSYVSIYK